MGFYILGKRKRVAELGGTYPGSPDAWDLTGDRPRKRRRLTTEKGRFSLKEGRLHTRNQMSESRMSNELLEYILNYEDAFQSRNRLASLYADFRLQLNTNPEGYYANISAWKKALADAAKAGKIPGPGETRDLLKIRTGDALAHALQHPKYGIPTCLSAVFEDAVNKREFIPVQDFLTSQTSVYKRSWLPSPIGVVKWSLRQLGVLGPPGAGRLGVGDFVVLRNVEAAAEEVLERMKEHNGYAVDRVLSRSDFAGRFKHALTGKTKLSQRDMDILLVFLAREKVALSFNEHAVKFKAENEAVPLPINQEDMAIANLRDTLARIRAQIEPLEQRVAEMDTATREAVKRGNKIQAKTALRSKKLAESALQQRTDVALQLEGVYAQLQQAADHVEVVEAMRQGAIALQGLNEKVGGAEGATAVVDMMNERMATTEEITNIINETGQPVDEMEIEDEFEALEQAEKEKQEREGKAAREKQEAEEAAQVAAKFAEVDKLEQERKEKEKQAGSPAKNSPDKQLSQSFTRMSFHEDDLQQDDEKRQAREPVYA